LESINLEKQTANGLSTSRTKATPNSLDRCAQCRADRVHHTLAHLLAAHSNATPKQAKEPIFATRILGNLTTINLNNDKYHFGQFVGLGHSHKNQ